MGSHYYRVEPIKFTASRPSEKGQGTTALRPEHIGIVLAAVCNLYLEGDGGEVKITGTDFDMDVEASFNGGERSYPDWDLWRKAAPFIEDTEPVEVADLDDADPTPWFFRIHNRQFEECGATIMPGDPSWSEPKEIEAMVNKIMPCVLPADTDSKEDTAVMLDAQTALMQLRTLAVKGCETTATA